MNREPIELEGDVVAWTKRVFRIAFRQTFGWTLLGVGVAGLVLPVLPGWLLIAWGVLVLAPDIPLFQRLIDRIEHKLPRLKAALHRMKRRDGKDEAKS